MKTVYLFDAETGAYAGTYEAQESPLEPGVFIMPKASVTVAPPAFNAQSHAARWSGSAWVIEALPAPPEPEPPTDAEILAAFTAAIQLRLDTFARTRSYDGILSACTYVTSSVPKFAGEAAYCVGARDATWATGYQILADVQAGDRAMPTVDQVMTELPPLEWPQ